MSFLWLSWLECICYDLHWHSFNKQLVIGTESPTIANIWKVAFYFAGSLSSVHLSSNVVCPVFQHKPHIPLSWPCWFSSGTSIGNTLRCSLQSWRWLMEPRPLCILCTTLREQLLCQVLPWVISRLPHSCAASLPTGKTLFLSKLSLRLSPHTLANQAEGGM